MTLVPKGDEAMYSSTRVCAAQANSITRGSGSEGVPTLSEADNDDVSVWELVGPLLVILVMDAEPLSTSQIEPARAASTTSFKIWGTGTMSCSRKISELGGTRVFVALLFR